MKLIRPSCKIITPLNGTSILKEIEEVARTCYKSEDKITEDGESAVALIKGVLLKRNHEAMLEFGPSITVKFICDRGVSHELVRHRLCSFAQESTRYCNYSKDKFSNQVTFIIPSWMNNYLPTDDAMCGTDDAWWETYKELNDPCLVWLNSMQVAENNYNELIKLGWKPEQARSVLPNSLKTEINLKANIREWRHIFKQRISLAAHPQMRELMVPLLKEFQEKIPVLFDDLNS